MTISGTYRLFILSLLVIPLLALILPVFRLQAFRISSLFSPARMARGPVIALSHGGGPMPILGDPGHKDIIQSLKQKVPNLLKLGTSEAPRAIILVTAHWSESNPTISNGSTHKLLYDYYGFPKEAYQVKYPASGSPEIAQEVASALRSENLKPEFDDERGWDHGVFVPMILVNPAADVPVVQMSVLSSEDPAKHFAMGRALEKLRDSNIAVVGSGFASIHNLRALFDGTIHSPGFVSRNKAWSNALGEAVAEEDSTAREKKLAAWRSFPNAYEMHPRNAAEHFMPLIVCAGAGGQGKAKSYSDNYMGVGVWSYYWE